MKRILLLKTAMVAAVLLLSACGVDTVTAKDTYLAISAPSNQSADNHTDDDDDHDKESLDIVKLTDEAAREAGIIVSQAELGPLGQSISLPAEIRFDADQLANISPKVSGIIAGLYASEGDTVKRGDTLALISSRELAGLKAVWLKAQTQFALAEKALAREEKLFADKITAEADVQAARANYEAVKAAKDAAENELHAAGVSDAALAKVATADDGDNANAYLSAPISGTIVRRGVTLGETVSAGDAGSQTLFTIADDSVVWADIGVYKQDISRIREQAPVVLKSDEGIVLAESTVAFILPIINETSRTATARVILDNPDGNLRPGQFVTADISVGQSQPVLRVPLASVQMVENKRSVFVPVDGGFAPQAVMTGSESGGFVEIRSGLRAGDSFVSDGAFTLKAQLEKAAFGDDHGH
jgi:cobalt-zinc-cadmium efflux system membrane fusion protein